MKNSVLIFILSFISFANISFAHGLKTEVSFKNGVVIVKSSYSHNNPISNASVKIYSPVDSENIWQKGQTDNTGSFAFLPEMEGEWIFVVDDLKGHKKKTLINYKAEADVKEKIEEDKNLEAVNNSANQNINEEELTESGKESGLKIIHKLIIGLSLIFGISGIFYGIKAGKK